MKVLTSREMKDIDRMTINDYRVNDLV